MESITTVSNTSFEKIDSKFYPRCEPVMSHDFEYIWVSMMLASAVHNIAIPDTGDQIELICDLCAHRIVKVYYNETIKIDDEVRTERKTLQ